MKDYLSEHFFSTISTILSTLSLIVFFVKARKPKDDGLLTFNKSFPWEPAFLARLRWIGNAQRILWGADKEAQGRPYRLCRGDADLIILPPDMMTELNNLGPTLNSREYHAFGLLGHLTGMDVVRLTSFHVRVLLSYISPALPELFSVMAARISTAVANEFPQSHKSTRIKPNRAVVRCISEAIALILFGEEMTQDNPDLVHLTHEHTYNVFQVCFAMRCVPRLLQPYLVWLLPAKWKLISGWKKFRNYVIPTLSRHVEARRARKEKGYDKVNVNSDVISWMVEDGRNELERDPQVLTTLVGSIGAGSTYSITKFCCCAIADMVAHPEVLDVVRTEIREKHAAINGRWDLAALASLEKLESAMKESARLTPGTLLIYGRVVKKDCVLSNGVTLRKGQLVSLSCATRTMDPTLFEAPEEYRGLRFCTEDQIKKHRARPFSSVDTDILIWGAGRWSCPGRLITDISAKILLVKLLDEYDFAFIDGKELPQAAFHEFLFFHPENEMLVRRREDDSGIVFV